MLEIIKKIISSRLIRFIFSATLIYFAFRKIDVSKLLAELKVVPWWFVVGMLVYSLGTMFYGSWKWSLLLLDRVTFKDLLMFVKAGYMGMFYSLFFPTAVAGDLIKWMPLMKKYPEISKARLASSVVMDRMIGLTAFSIVGLISLVAGKVLQYQFPDILLFLFGGLNLAIGVFYALVFTIDFDKLFGKVKVLRRLLEMVGILKAENKKRLFKCFVISLIGEPVWMAPFWLYSLIFGAGISLLQTYIFVPVISLILILPISIAGFGARETLFLYFLEPLGFSPDKILLVSTFGGIIGVLNSLVGGIATLF
ncbi:flippase-like domain-containing protein [Candidatus Shapirobacteria bacterium]|nr:flippase-like domain-containing protein [Candidatus Shapirobacteria bacterium]